MLLRPTSPKFKMQYWYRASNQTKNERIKLASSRAVLLKSSRPHYARPSSVTPPLVSLHVAPDAECFTTTRMRTFKRLLSSVAVAMDFETAGPREGFMTRRADVPVLRLWVGRMTGRINVVVVLPRIRGRQACCCDHWARHDRWEVGWKRSLLVESVYRIYSIRRVVRARREATW